MRTLSLALLAVLAISGCDQAAKPAQASAPRSFPLSVSEAQSIKALMKEDAALSSEIAAVESQNPTLAAGVKSFRDRSVRLVLDEIALREAASREHGVPVVLVVSGSGVAWVETSR